MDSQACKCGAMAEEVLSGTSNLSNWISQVDTQLNSIRSEGVSGGTPSEPEQRILQNITSDLQVIHDCIAKKTACIAKLGTTLSGSQDTILSLKEQIASEREGVEIAQQRLAYSRAPEQRTSFYQSWFPMDRPLKLVSVPILIGFSLFFLLVGLGTLLLSFGVNLGFYIPGLQLDPRNPDRSWADYFKNKAISSFPNTAIKQRYDEIQKQAYQKQRENQKAQAEAQGRNSWMQW
jgi:hypothetical protein